MKLSEYVKQDFVNDLDYYKDTIGYADLSQPGWKDLGNVYLPAGMLNFVKDISKDERKDGHNLDNVYTYGRHPDLNKWATETFPHVSFQDVRVQMQKPGDKVDPHVDTLFGQITKWIEQEPKLGEIEHSMENPNPDFHACRYFIAVEDHVDGQEFIINNKPWIWKSGDAISLNVWRAIHHTKNNSEVNRYIIKVTGIETK